MDFTTRLLTKEWYRILSLWETESNLQQVTLCSRQEEFGDKVGSTLEKPCDHQHQPSVHPAPSYTQGGLHRAGGNCLEVRGRS